MKRNALSTILVTFIIASILIPKGFSQPNLPCWFYGNVGIDGLPAPDNLNVTAMISGTNLNWTTQTKNATYGETPSFNIPYDDSSTPNKDGGVDGDTIEFYINGTRTNQTATYASDELIKVDLWIGAPYIPDLNPPSISIISPENKTYPSGDVQLTFTVNETTSWIGYSLDGSLTNQTTVIGNATISGLTVGSHNITVYANDTAGNLGSSETAFFSIEASQDPVPLLILAVALPVIIIVGATGILLYKRHNHRNRHKP